MKKVIYGTGYVAERIFNELCEDGYVEDIEFFIDSLVDKKSFLNKKVVSPEYLSQINPNDYEYYLGSIGSQHSMKMELLARGVNEKNIVLNNDYSEANFERQIEDINKILVYPPVQDDSIENKLKLLLGKEYEYAEIVYAKTVDDIFMDVDLVLIWDMNALKYARKRNDGKVYCIDRNFYSEIDYRIIGRLGCKLKRKKDGDLYNIISKKNYARLCKVGYKNAFVFGNGPTLDEGLLKCNKLSCESSFKLLINGIRIDGFDANAYAFVDAVYLDDTYGKNMLDQAIDIAKKNNMYIIVPYFWMHFLVNWYKNIEDNIIGLDFTANEICFPSKDDLRVYRKAGNVITNMAIPFASSLVDEIFISGCDGAPVVSGNEHTWEYSKLCVENRSSKGAVNYDMIVQHNRFFGELLEYGEGIGKKYIVLTKSYIPCLKKRLSNVKDYICLN